MSRSLPWLALVMLATGCDTDSTAPLMEDMEPDALIFDAYYPPDRAFVPDRALPADADPDAAPDARIEPTDAAADTGLDAMVDAAADAALDRGLDAAVVDARVVVDAELDAAPIIDLGPDAFPDAERWDVGSPFRDVGPVDPFGPCELVPCVCEPGAVERCYPGPDGTEGIGACVAGTRTCAEDGQGFGPCVGGRGPVGENCRTPVDEDCDGETPPCSDDWVHTYAAHGDQAVRSVAVLPGGDVLVLMDFEGPTDLGAGVVHSRHVEAADVGLARYDRQGNPVWSLVWGDASDDFGGQLAVGPAGEIAVLVRFYGAMIAGDHYLDSGGFDDIGVVLVEPDGEVRWARSFGGVERDGSERIAFDPDGRVLLTGRFSGDVRFGMQVFECVGEVDTFFALLDGPDGELLVAHHGVGEDDLDEGRGVGAAPDGTLYVAGRFDDTFHWGGEPVQSAGRRDIFLSAFDPEGAHLWTRRFGGPSDDGLYDMAVDPETGSVFLFGWFGEAFDYGGDAPLDDAGGTDFFVMRVDVDGSTVGAAFGDRATQSDFSFADSSYGAIAVGPDGVYVAGPIVGDAFGIEGVDGTDGFVAHLDHDLEVVGALGFGTRFTEMALDVDVDPADGAVVFGGRYFSRTGPTIGPFGPLEGADGSDGFVARFTGLDPPQP